MALQWCESRHDEYNYLDLNLFSVDTEIKPQIINSGQIITKAYRFISFCCSQMEEAKKSPYLLILSKTTTKLLKMFSDGHAFQWYSYLPFTVQDTSYMQSLKLYLVFLHDIEWYLYPGLSLENKCIYTLPLVFIYHQHLLKLILYYY